MNFFGHAWLAAGRAPEPTFVLGAMAPDLWAMAGRRAAARAALRAAGPGPPASAAHGAGPAPAAAAAALRAVGTGDALLARGVAFHAATDAAFHGALAFGELAREAGAWLRARGVRRGPARAAAHVGLELLLDGWLAREAGVPAAYREALAHEARHDAAGLAALCRRLRVSPLPEAYARPRDAARRLAAVLARRPRLALAAGEREHLVGWAAHAAARLDADAPALLAEVEARLAQRPPPPAEDSGASGEPGGG